MPEEYIMTSKGCVYVLGGSESRTAALYDFDGVYVLEGGFEENSLGFVAHVRDVTGVILSAPTKHNLGTTAALLAQQNKSLPVFVNSKPLKGAKEGSSGEVLKAIQEANSKLLSVGTPVFTPQYPAHIIYQSGSKGVLSLYVIAGDAKDGEAITKALASGNEAEVERAAAEHGTIGVLLWRPAVSDEPAVRILISGTSSMARIQQSLDKAAKALPFLNAPIVKSKDALTAIPAPSAPRPAAVSTAGKGAVRPTPPSSSSRPAAATSRAPLRSTPTTAPTARPATNTSARSSAPPSRSTTTTKAATAPKPAAAPAKPRAAPTNGAARGAKPAAASVRGATASTRSSQETVAQKKIVGKVQGAAPSKTSAPAPGAKKPAAPAAKTAAPVKKSSTPPQTAAPVAPVAPITEPIAAPVVPTPPQVVVDLDDSVICLGDNNQGFSGEPDIIVIPPTPEPPRTDEVVDALPKQEEPVVDDVEPEIPTPIDAFKKPEPSPERDEQPAVPAPEDVKEPSPSHDEIREPSPAPVPPVDDVTEPSPAQEDAKPDEPFKTDDIVPHPEPSAPVVPADHVIITTEDPALPDIAAAVPFSPAVPRGKDDGLIQLDDDLVKIAPGFEEPLIPQAPRDDGTLADCSEEVSKLVEISMDTDKSDAETTVKAPGEVTQLATEFKQMHLDEACEDYVRKLSNQMVEDATLPFTSALASSIAGIEKAPLGQEVNGNSEKPLVDFDSNGHQEEKKEASKHDLMQSRSSVVEQNGAPVEYETTDPEIDKILNACANESEQLDAAHSNILHMPSQAGVPVTKIPRFARPYFFDVVTLPRNDRIETTLTGETAEEFVSKIRSRHYVLPSKDISTEQLEGVLRGKRLWMSGEANIIPTHSAPALLDFRHKEEESLKEVHLTLSVPVEKQRTTVASDEGTKEYPLTKIDLH